MRATDCRKVNEVPINIDLMIFKQLQEFRQTLYDTLGNARDTLFDLMDAVLVSASIASFVSLSQSPVFRRGWSSLYSGLQESQIPRRKVLKLLIKEIPTHVQPMLVGDLSRWNRPAAKTLKDRTLTGAGTRASRSDTATAP
jgi:hypothetical protein